MRGRPDGLPGRGQLNFAFLHTPLLRSRRPVTPLRVRPWHEIDDIGTPCLLANRAYPFLVRLLFSVGVAT
jgi:hypothetical protein